MVPWILVMILVALIVVGVIVTVITIDAKKKGKKRSTDYYNFFMMGVIWLPFGILLWLMDTDSPLGMIFFVLGIAYMTLGLAHKEEWKKNHVPFHKLSKSQQWWKMIVITFLGFLVVAGLVIIYLMKKNIFG